METQAISPKKPEKLQTTWEQTADSRNVETVEDKIDLEKASQPQKNHVNTDG